MTTITSDAKMEELKSYIETVKKKDRPESYLIAILHKAQNLYGYLDKDVMNEIAHIMNLPTAHIWGVATFYHYFNLKPKGKHTIAICLGTACYVKGASDLLDTLTEELKITIGETTHDQLFTLQEARCLGACGLAPVIMIDEKIYGEMTPKKVVDLLNHYRKEKK
ncbi:MAG: NADH-quinone oxidoreductase subunit NuoE [Endomicrobiales bacterium]|jgi:NADH-quinone oxidoreductase subunit E/NADP-reducing hydrogenase subunit HndA